MAVAIASAEAGSDLHKPRVPRVDVPRVAKPALGMSNSAGAVLALQHAAGNGAVAAMLVQRCGDGSPCGCGCSDEETEAHGPAETAAPPVQRAPAEDGQPETLTSTKFAGNSRLERAFHNSPSIHIGESGDGVRLVQEALVDQGIPLPGSTKPTGDLDGGFGQETFDAVKQFQGGNGLTADGVVGHDTLGTLDRLEAGGPEPPLLKPKPGDQPSVITLPGGLQILVGPDGLGNEFPGLGGLGNLFGSPGGTMKPPKTQADEDDKADEERCAELPASQMGAAVNDVLSWQSSADDATLVGRIGDIICFPRDYMRLVAGIAVGLSFPAPGASQRVAMLGQMRQALDDFAVVLELAKTPGMTALGLPVLSEARAKRVSDRIVALRAIAVAQSSVTSDARMLAAAALASGEVGKVDHKLIDGGRRYGADRLLEYFRTAFGGSVPASQEDTINKPPSNVKQLFSCAVQPIPPCDTLAPWCGIFASWALQSGGLALPPWSLQDGKGLNQRGGWRQLTQKAGDSVQPGDLATRSTGNHQALVTVARPGEIETAEGNTNEGGGSGIEAAIGGKIVHKSYQGVGLVFKDWDQGFFRPPGIGPAPATGVQSGSQAG